MTPLRSNLDYYDGTIPWVQTAELQDNFIYDSREKVTKIALEETSLKLNPVDTLLIAMYGQGKTRGRTGLAKIKAATNQACCAIYPNYNLFIPEYLQIWFIYNYENLRKMSESRGGNQPNLNGEVIKGLIVPFPDKTMQEKIISGYNNVLQIYNELDENIRLEEEAITNLPTAILNSALRKSKSEQGLVKRQ